MPAKSKRKRRNMSKVGGIDPSVRDSISTSADSNVTNQVIKGNAQLISEPKPSVSSDTAFPYFFGELKWIGIVTGIIIVLLIIAYVFFH